jgi:hypothetical protein
MKKMYCPLCHSPLNNGKDKKYETLCEHVSDPNMEDYPLRPTFVCGKETCECHKQEVFWDESGDIYGGFKIKFIDGRDSAYPSFGCKMDTEIYKKGFKDKIVLPPFLMLWFLQPIIEFNYKADEWGMVLKRTWCLKWLKKDKLNPFYKDKFGYHVYYTFPFVSIIHTIKHNNSLIKNNKLSQNYKHSELKRIFEPISSWDKRWWRHFGLWLSKVLFYQSYIKTKNLN